MIGIQAAQSPDGGDRVAFVDNDKKHNTCHFLHAMEKKVFLPGSEHFDGEWLVELQPQTETSEAYATLYRAAMEMSDLKHSFCRLLVETSADFSLRQIPKAHPDIEVAEEFSRAANARVPARALPTLERTFYLDHWWCQQRALFRRLRVYEL